MCNVFIKVKLRYCTLICCWDLLYDVRTSSSRACQPIYYTTLQYSWRSSFQMISTGPHLHSCNAASFSWNANCKSHFLQQGPDALGISDYLAVSHLLSFPQRIGLQKGNPLQNPCLKPNHTPQDSLKGKPINNCYLTDSFCFNCEKTGKAMAIFHVSSIGKTLFPLRTIALV